MNTSLLRDTLRSVDPDLHSRAIHLIANSNRLTPFAVASFPTGTSHGPDHTRTLETIGDTLLATGLIADLNPHEQFYLLLSYYFHDLGMVGTEDKFSTQEGREQLRREHAIAVGVRLREQWRELGFATQQEAEILGDICRGHRPKKDAGGQASWNDIAEKRIVAPNTFIRLRVLCALIYSIDELHIGADRADKRVEDWIEIKNDESKRHWCRHQSISGPAIPDAMLEFIAQPKTIAFEGDLRRNVFAKAFTAFADLSRELQSASITRPIPKLKIEWNRLEIWRLLILYVAASKNTFSKSELVQSALAAFRAQQAELLSLSKLCDESRDDDDFLKDAIATVFNELFVLDVLKASGPDVFYLATSEPAFKAVTALLQDADKIDRLFIGVFAATHEFSFYREVFGRRFVEDQLKPYIRDAYGVEFLSNPYDAHVAQLLAVSPSAARLVKEVHPFPSDIVKRRLLCFTVMTGFLRDSQQDPTLILNKATRDAVYFISQMFTDYRSSIAFLEELALVVGLTTDQILEVFASSEEWERDTRPVGAKDSTITLTQEVPARDAPLSTAFPHLYLAGIRSGVAIQLKCNYGSSITIDPQSRTGQGGEEVSSEAPFTIGVGPGEPHMLPTADFACEIESDLVSKLITLRIFPLSEPESATKPFMIRLPSPESTSDGFNRCAFTLVLSNISVFDMQQLRSLSAFAPSDDAVEVQAVLGDSQQRVASLTWTSSLAPVRLNARQSMIVDRLSTLDPKTPFPWCCRPRDIEAILASSFETIEKVVDGIRSGHQISPLKIVSFTLIVENADGVAYQREFLGFFPGLKLPSPLMEPGSKVSQEEMDRIWYGREKILRLETKLREDTAAVAESFREWGHDPSKEFPVSIDNSIPQFHQIKTVYSLELHPPIDRFWYIELPTFVRLRSATRREQMEMELRFWKSKGDEQRSMLVEEKIMRMNVESEPASEKS